MNMTVALAKNHQDSFGYLGYHLKTHEVGDMTWYEVQYVSEDKEWVVKMFEHCTTVELLASNAIPFSKVWGWTEGQCKAYVGSYLGPHRLGYILLVDGQRRFVNYIAKF